MTDRTYPVVPGRTAWTGPAPTPADWLTQVTPAHVADTETVTQTDVPLPGAA